MTDEKNRAEETLGELLADVLALIDETVDRTLDDEAVEARLRLVMLIHGRDHPEVSAS